MASILSVDQLQSKDGSSIVVSGDVSFDLQNVQSFMEIPAGSQLQRPANVAAGTLRWNNDENNVEVYDGFTWRLLKKSRDFQRALTGSIITYDFGNEISYSGNGPKVYNYETYENSANLTGTTFSSSNGGIINFNGSSDYGSVSFPTSKLYPITAISMECWFKTTNETVAQTLIGLQNGIATNASYKLGITGTEWTGGIFTNGSYNALSVPYTSFPLDPNEWYQFVYTFSGTSFNVNFLANTTSGSNVLTNVSNVEDIAAGYTITGLGIPDGTTVVSKTTNTITISNPAAETYTGVSVRVTVPAGARLYVNGQVIGSNTLTGIIEYNENNSEVTFGTINRGNGTDTGKQEFLNGSIGLVRIYGKSLREGQVLTNLNSIRDRFLI